MILLMNAKIINSYDYLNRLMFFQNVQKIVFFRSNLLMANFDVICIIRFKVSKSVDEEYPNRFERNAQWCQNKMRTAFFFSLILY